MTRFIRCALAVCVLLGMVGSAFSQSRNTGEIRGTVTAAGAVVQGATITLTNVDTGETKDFVTNADGIYDTVSTPAGNYTPQNQSIWSGLLRAQWHFGAPPTEEARS